MSSPTTELGVELLAVVARFNRLATQRSRPPLPWAQARLLSMIEEAGEARISDLATRDNCSQPTMTTQVRRLEEAGLATRTADATDGRAVLIRITDKGVRTLQGVRVDRAAVIDPLLEQLDPADREVLGAAVDVFRRLLKTANPSPAEK